MRISGCNLTAEFPPFQKTEIRFQEKKEASKLAEVVIFTGPNGTGKSRLLRVLAASLMNGTLKCSSFKGGQLTISPKIRPSQIGQQKIHNLLEKSVSEAGKLICLTSILQPKTNTPQATFAFSPSRLTSPVDKIQVLAPTQLAPDSERLSFEANDIKGLPQRIANLKVQAAMESLDAIDGDSSSTRWTGPVSRLERGLTKLIGLNFSIVARAHPSPELLFRWGSGPPLPLSALPDGFASILSWVINLVTLMDLAYPESSDPLAEPAIILVDEPETHLHPQWQRRVLPFVQQLFPAAQIIISTHSPFIVSSLNEGTIFKLTPDKDGKVTVSEPIPASPGDSFISAASDILDTPEWYDPESEALLNDFRQLREETLASEGDDADLRKLADEIRGRSTELANVIGAEMNQFDRLQKTASTK